MTYSYVLLASWNCFVCLSLGFVCLLWLPACCRLYACQTTGLSCLLPHLLCLRCLLFCVRVPAHTVCLLGKNKTRILKPLTLSRCTVYVHPAVNTHAVWNAQHDFPRPISYSVVGLKCSSECRTTAKLMDSAKLKYTRAGLSWISMIISLNSKYDFWYLAGWSLGQRRASGASKNLDNYCV